MSTCHGKKFDFLDKYIRDLPALRIIWSSTGNNHNEITMLYENKSEKTERAPQKGYMIIDDQKMHIDPEIVKKYNPAADGQALFLYLTVKWIIVIEAIAQRILVITKLQLCFQKPYISHQTWP